MSLYLCGLSRPSEPARAAWELIGYYLRKVRFSIINQSLMHDLIDGYEKYIGHKLATTNILSRVLHRPYHM